MARHFHPPRTIKDQLMMTNVHLQQAQILAALQEGPLDRVRIMKTLFLYWHRSGRPSTGPFKFRPYLFGPCAFDVYTALEDMEKRGWIVRASHPIDRWAPYYLTPKGRQAVSSCQTPTKAAQAAIQGIARWSASQDFRSLLDHVYAEAPDYATESLLRAREQNL
jgi:hypothetical protein